MGKSFWVKQEPDEKYSVIQKAIHEEKGTSIVECSNC